MSGVPCATEGCKTILYPANQGPNRTPHAICSDCHNRRPRPTPRPRIQKRLDIPPRPDTDRNKKGQ